MSKSDRAETAMEEAPQGPSGWTPRRSPRHPDSDTVTDNTVSPAEMALLERGANLEGIQRWAFNCVTWKRFDDLILMFIAINCISMAVYDPLDPDDETTRNQALSVIEYLRRGEKKREKKKKKGGEKKGKRRKKKRRWRTYKECKHW
eukprot:TRINITY_DN2287_c0_g1_i1.p1 TRINITY_DN2287_c0_g1~~TRINITY_DN2287_c0_g1_i1.p1  ORF type:complete len:147 (-),score=12.20 TRINITY_DN2287_c0_g1_i1:57-497(-)